MNKLLQRFFGMTEAPKSRARRRVVISEVPETIYAIGDIHGCLTALKSIETKIFADAVRRDGEKLIVYIGDYVDRGPSSASVIDHLIAPPPSGFHRVCLAGNHEDMFLDFIERGARSDAWLSVGGEETLASYGIYLAGHKRNELEMQVRSSVPDEHIEFMRALPAMLQVGNYCFVHAGIDPALPLDQQNDRVLLWSRPDEFKWPTHDMKITAIHGHTPVQNVDIARNRINIDIGAYHGGVLAAIRLTANDLFILLSD